MNKKIWLIILDWFWINDEKEEDNAIKLANSPTFDKLFASNYTKLEASALSVWLPEWQIWSSEVWHLTIWAGRTIKQFLVEINDLFKDRLFEEIEEFKNWINHCLLNDSSLHLIILFWDWGVHAHQNHLEWIIKIIPKEINIKLHLFWDGRDLPFDAMLNQLQKFSMFIEDFNNVEITTISWRFFWMDRALNWDRTKKAYDIMCLESVKTDLTPLEYVKNSYSKWIYDEQLEPINFTWNTINSNDAIFHLNFRSDRCIQLTQSFCEKKFNHFERNQLQNIFFATMTKYYKEYDENVFIKTIEIKNTIWEVISKNNLKQLHLAETEKFSHVTKFFNWWKNIVFKWEEDIIIPTKNVITYDLVPEMSAYEIMEKYFEKNQDFDFTVINFANWDMVWHTGNLEASIKAIETLDDIISKIISYSKQNNIELFITADHWNCEEMEWDMKTSHTLNLVPFWHISKWENIELKEKHGTLADVAPTILSNFWIEIPIEMNGKVLS